MRRKGAAMSDRMHPIPFEALLEWALAEYRTQGAIFGIRRFYQPPEGAGQPYMGRRPNWPRIWWRGICAGRGCSS